MNEDGSELSRLRQRVAHLEARAELGLRVDHLVESTLSGAVELPELLGAALELLIEATGVDGAWIEVEGAARIERFVREPTATRLERALSVDGVKLGRLGLAYSGPDDAVRTEELEGFAETWSEVLDDHIALVRLGVEAHALHHDLSASLADATFDAALAATLDTLFARTAFDEALIAYRAAGDAESPRWVWRRRVEGRVECRGDAPALAPIAAAGFVEGPQALLHLTGLESGFFEELSLASFGGTRVGQVFFGRQGEPLGRFERQAGEVFADGVRQRLDGYSREHAELARTFGHGHVRRLLARPGYRAEVLAPREAEAAVLFADIAGFTALCETVLGSPRLIGQLVDTWSSAVVRAVWDTGGVFDKTVGDCVIAHWGPPFFDLPERERCARALEAAIRIRDITRALPERAPELATLEGRLGVATGLGWVPVFIGHFGPNDGYTALSSGVNATARLQGVAGRDEILCLDGFVEALGSEAGFGPLQRAQVKNVKDPLRFRKLLLGEDARRG